MAYYALNIGFTKENEAEEASSSPNIIEVEQVHTECPMIPQICNASAEANMKHTLKQMQCRFAVIYETPNTSVK